MKTFHRFAGAATLIGLTASPAFAAKLASFCTLKSMDPNAKIEGVEVDKRMPIASVSKVATAWWSVSVKSLDFRFPTAFHVTPAGDGAYNVHIEGSRDPYFGLQSFHFAISELNKRGIKKINRLTFDENFKFFRSPTSEDVAIGFYNTASPSSATVLSQLQANPLTSGWANTVAVAKQAGATLVAKPEFSVKSMAFVARADAKDAAETKVYYMRSAPLEGLLKEMNRNSNNHAANQIFEHMGGAAKFQEFAKTTLQLGEKDIRFVNGSGDRADFDDGSRYNEASCSAMLRIMKNLRAKLIDSGKDLQNVMAVVGRDTSSTASRIYGNDTTSGAVVAKTGTVSPDITLAGIIHTKEGDYYFMYNMATNGTRADWNSARAQIRKLITDLIKKYKGPDPMKYASVSFVSFDKDSIMVDELTSGGMK